MTEEEIKALFIKAYNELREKGNHQNFWTIGDRLVPAKRGVSQERAARTGGGDTGSMNIPTVAAEGVIRITGRGITAELPQDISAELLEGLSSC